ncbi:MAG TPA: cobalamin-binding protein [Longimicrobiaceae bacterium]|nr:cobalamin-binding protein [Longimicrobiaceae bacterium]
MALLCACEQGAPPREAAPADSAVVLRDDAGVEVRLAGPARRIVSLVPSATDLLAAIGAGDRLVARTDFDHGPGLDSLPSVGGGLDPSLEALAALRPDVVISWETRQGATLRDRLGALGIPVLGVRANDTTDVFRVIRTLGVLTGRPGPADSLARSIRAELAAVRASVAGRTPRSVLYVAWPNPPTVPGRETFHHQLLELAGGRSVFDDVPGEWPQVSLEEVVRRQPEVVLVPAGEDSQLSAAALRRATGWRELNAFAAGRVVELPAVVVNRPGPRLGEAARLIRDAIHPDLAGQ